MILLGILEFRAFICLRDFVAAMVKVDFIDLAS